MKKKLLVGLATGLFLVGMVGVASATPIELVVNGEFEIPDVPGTGWAAVPQASVDGWSSDTGLIEIWNQGFLSSPILGSDGFATGQHHEVAYNSSTNFTTQDLAIVSNGTVDFSFDAWERDATGIDYSLTGSLSGLLASGSHYFTGSSDWEAISATSLSVMAGETLSLWFSSISGGSCGVHIDQVSLQYEAAPVPEPATMLLFGTGLAGLVGTTLRRKKKA